MIPKEPMRQHNPWIVYTVRDLFALFGLGVWVFLASQVGAAFIVGKFAVEHLKIPLAVAAGVHLGVCAIVDVITYILHRGKLHTAFMKPALVVLALTVAPFVLLWFGNFIFDLQARR